MTDSASKTCTKCGLPKDLDDFGRDRSKPDGRRSRCRECRNGRQRQYHQANRDAELDRQRSYYEANRDAFLERNVLEYAHGAALVLDLYATRRVAGGPACTCCGRVVGLEIDHVHGGGNAHRLELFGQKGGRFYEWLVENDFPADPPLQVLCQPCNGSKGDGPRCRLFHGDRLDAYLDSIRRGVLPTSLDELVLR